MPNLTPPNDYTAYLNPARLGTTLTVRTQLPGDRFRPLGLAGEKKLQDFFTDTKVPRRWRDRIPLVIAEDKIAWVVGCRIAEWAKVPEVHSPDDGVLRLSFELDD